MEAQVTESTRVALLVIRAWCEDDGEPSLRARILEIPDLEAPKERVSMTGRREELHAIIDRWLDNLHRT